MRSSIWGENGLPLSETQARPVTAQGMPVVRLRPEMHVNACMRLAR